MSNKIKEWKVYKLTSPNGRVYIGCTELPLNRRWENGSNYRYNKELFADIVQYGWNEFTKEVLLTTSNEVEAREAEHHEIKNYPEGYNLYRGINYRYDPNWQPERKAVLCVETNTVYDSIYQAAKATGLAKNKISYCCRGIRKKTGGFHWKFVSSDMSL